MSSHPTLLIVDDEPDLCRTLKKSLTKEGYRVLIATSGRQALSLLKRERVHLLLLDLKMPGMGGLDLLAALKSPTVRKPYPAVVVMTAYGSLATAREAMALGAVDYLTKPFDLDVVKTVVREALRR